MSEELSRSEQLFGALASGSVPANFVPQSRLEELLLAYIKGEKPNRSPQSRLEELLCACCNSSQGGTIVDAVLTETTITENGTHTPPAGVDGFSKVEVNVPAPDCPAPILEPLTATENGEYVPGEGVDGFGRVTVEVEGSGEDLLPFGGYFSIAPPTKEKLLSLGYAVHEFTLISTPTAIWTIPNPLGEVPKEIVALFRVGENAKDVFETDYPVYAVNTEFVNGTYTNQNTFVVKRQRIPNDLPEYAKSYEFAYGSYRWLAALPNAENITLRSPIDSSSVAWQPGEYILAVK